MKYYISAVRSVFCATKGASGREDPGTRSDLFLFFFLSFFLVFVSFPQKPIRVKICVLVRGIRIMHIARIVNIKIYGCVNFIFLCSPETTSISRELRHTATGAANTQPKPWLKISLILRRFFFFSHTHRAVIAQMMRFSPKDRQ